MSGRPDIAAGRAHRAVTVLAGVVVLLTGAVAIAPRAQAQTAPLIAAAGDIACAPINGGYNDGKGNAFGCRQRDTAELLAQKPYAAVLPLGDLVNGEDVSLDAFLTAYEPTWGRFRAISHPAIGNHEYDDWAGATGYWDYWNGIGAVDGQAGVRGRGWYAYDVGPWRLIALNSNCTLVGCRYSSRQGAWLRRQLERNSERCVLAYMHHSRFSSGAFGSRNLTRGLWRALYRGGADVVLNGHEHFYERFGPQRPSGKLDRRRGVSQFTVGTGGWYLFPFVALASHSRFAWNGGFGILTMRLRPKSLGWSFLTTPTGASIDHGKLSCHNELDLPRESRRRRSG